MHSVPFLLCAAAASASLAQFVPPADDSAPLKVVESPANRSITVSYKEPEGACTTTSDDQKQYTGWVNIPGDYETNLFFWFVEAREPTDTLTIWLNGGPGSSSMYGFFAATGPCEIVETGMNEYDTVAREWGWDRASNMLFIDQPNQVGFSYDIPTNGTLSLSSAEIEQPPLSLPPEEDLPTWAALNGTFSSTNTSRTANTTDIAADAVWHLLQGFLGALPQYRPPTNGSVGVNLFAESYGGRYGPIFAETFEQQNDKRASGELPANTTVEIHLTALGIINGCIDTQIQTPLYPVFAANNTYGVKVLSDDDAAALVDLFHEDGGCGDLLERCASLAEDRDPEGEGDVDGVNDACATAADACAEIETAYYDADRGAYDIAHPLADPFPPMRFLDYLNQARVLRAVGSPVNFTMSSAAVSAEFSDTGDRARDGNVARLAALLNAGVRVGLVYGDRDYICNWLGGEAVSERIAEEAGGAYADGFAGAGYQDIAVNDSYVGGAVRQLGNLSFSRIYQAGHAAPAYQPETAFQVFARILRGRSVATGDEEDLSDYATEGEATADHTDDPPEAPKPTCYVRDLSGTCDQKFFYKLSEAGGGVVINGVLYADESDWSPPEDETATTSTAAPTRTGGSEATATPSGEGAAAGRGAPDVVMVVLALFVALSLRLA